MLNVTRATYSLLGDFWFLQQKGNTPLPTSFLSNSTQTGAERECIREPLLSQKNNAKCSTCIVKVYPHHHIAQRGGQPPCTCMYVDNYGEPLSFTIQYRICEERSVCALRSHLTSRVLSFVASVQNVSLPFLLSGQSYFPIITVVSWYATSFVAYASTFLVALFKHAIISLNSAPCCFACLFSPLRSLLTSIIVICPTQV